MADKRRSTLWLSQNKASKNIPNEILMDLFEGSSDNDIESDINDDSLDKDYDPNKDPDASSLSGDDIIDEPITATIANKAQDSVREKEPDAGGMGINHVQEQGAAADNLATPAVLDTEQESDGVRSTARSHARTLKPLTRKRKQDPSSWKSNVRKALRQSGQEYIDSNGKARAARQVKMKKDCTKCRFKCTANFSDAENEKIFKDFWMLNDNEKRHFYARTTEMHLPKRQRTHAVVSRKKNAIKYTLPIDGRNIRVCKQFYLGVLDISQKRIINYHATKNPQTGTPTHLKWGSSQNHILPPCIKEGIRAHIRSIPRVESHYCRAQANKEYVSTPGLSIKSLYEAYVEKCRKDSQNPGKLNVYREIFNNEFNIAFHFPKKDRCDKCEEAKVKGGEHTDLFAAHLKSKSETKEERDNDRQTPANFTICFDLENVFSLPQANVSNFFYRRKLNVYNMTAHCSINKRGYGAIWHEGQYGRAGNDIACAVMKLLHVIVEDIDHDPRLGHMILWSDSCVPQNRNSIFSTALTHFMMQHPQVNVIEHKYCEPGHSSIQEVDSLHSTIESTCRHAEIYSPVGLLRVLKSVKRGAFRLIQMKADDFKDFPEISKRGDYKKIPYTEVKCLRYDRKNPREIGYKKNFSDDFTSENVLPMVTTRGLASVDILVQTFQALKNAKPAGDLPGAKKTDIRAMLKFMPQCDKIYMEGVSK